MALRQKLEQIRDSKLEKPDPKKLIESWNIALDALYSRIAHKYLADYIRDGLISGPTYQPVANTEEDLGTYQTKSMSLRLADGRAIVLLPVGIHVMGARGRIDLFLEGKRNEPYWLLWTGEVDGAPEWLIHRRVTNEGRFNFLNMPLDKGQFENAIESLLN